MAKDSPILGNKHVNEFFRLSIAGGGYSIIAEMPEELNLNIEQEWENPFKLVLNDKLQGAYQMMSKAAGWDRNTLLWNYDQLFTYMGGTPIQLSFEVVFTARESVDLNIVQPIKALMKLASPSEKREAGAGSIVSSVVGEENASQLKRLIKPPSCTIYMGKVLKLRDVIITSVNPQFTRPLVSGDDTDFQGAPMRIPVNLTIQTKYIMTQSKVDEVFFNTSK